MLRNKEGGMAMVTPWPEAGPDVTAHAGTIVECVEHVACGLGGDAWMVRPVLREENGLIIGWDDQDLLPLGDSPDPRAVHEFAIAPHCPGISLESTHE